MTIDIKYHADIIPLEMTENGDWCDLRLAEDVTLKAGEFKILSLGVSMKLPEDCEALVIPRSSTFKRWGIIQVNSVGLIDNSYCGDNDIWGFPALATQDVTIEKNSRICQFRIQKKMDKVTFNTVDSLTGEDRGGFGSTGGI
jgi:dUTP pyrophosphatase